MRIRKAKLNDAPEIVRLHKDSILQENSKFYSKIQIKSWVENVTLKNCQNEMKDDFVLVAVENNKILGFSHFDKTGTIYEIYVHPKFMGQGIGGNLLKETERKLFGLGLKTTRANSALNALGFYEKYRYKRIKLIKYGEEKIDLIKMKKQLN